MKYIHYQVVGEEDYAFDITINSHGEFNISSGTYTSDRPRNGELTANQQQALLTAIDELGTPEDHPMPEGSADAFKAELVLGEGDNELVYPFWEGALQEDSKLLKLVRLLETI